MHFVVFVGEAVVLRKAHGKLSRGGLVVLCVLTISFAAAVLLLGRGFAAQRAREQAVAYLQAGSIGAAQERLARATQWSVEDGRNDLVQAAIHRHLGERERWNEALEKARAHGLSADAIRPEKILGELRWGETAALTSGERRRLQEANISAVEMATAAVIGALARDDAERVRETVDELARDPAARTAHHYLSGLYHQAQGEFESAQQSFQDALAAQPEHDLARRELARLLEERGNVSETLPLRIALAERLRDAEWAQLDLARTLRKLGRTRAAKRVLEPIAAREPVTREAALELAELAHETGDQKQAAAWYEIVDLDRAHIVDTLRTAATALALGGEQTEAERLFQLIASTQNQTRRVQELQARLRVDPNDSAAASELQQLAAGGMIETTSPGDDGSQLASPDYLQRCAACHGADGRGNGLAARHLYPRPRNLRSDPYRLVSTLNGVPTSDDIRRVIEQGMPGTSMPAYPDLSADELQTLVADVERLRREGARELLASAQDGDEPPSEEELDREMDRRLEPGDILNVPPFPPADSALLEQGRQMYQQANCHHCHGRDGTGQSDLRLFNDDGSPILARDLVHEPMEGGSDAAALYKRLRLGMPGTPHPATSTAGEDELIALVLYCQSLAAPDKRTLSNFERLILSAKP